MAPLDTNNPKSTIGNLSTKVENILTILKMAGCDGEIRTFSALELSGLVCKLTEDLRDKWDLHIKERLSVVLPTLGEFAVWLQEKASESLWWR